MKIFKRLSQNSGHEYSVTRQIDRIKLKAEIKALKKFKDIDIEELKILVGVFNKLISTSPQGITSIRGEDLQPTITAMVAVKEQELIDFEALPIECEE